MKRKNSDNPGIMRIKVQTGLYANFARNAHSARFFAHDPYGRNETGAGLRFEIDFYFFG